MPPSTRTASTRRPAAWWLDKLQQRRASRREPEFGPIRAFASDGARRAALKFFNAAYRAEQSGIGQAQVLSQRVAASDPELARILELYGAEEGWHQELLEHFLGQLGGGVMPMGRVTGLLFRVYARAKRPETIVLTNLMFETIGSTTYRMALGKVEDPSVREMLSVLTRDESFHVPLNVFFLRRFLEHTSPAERARLRRLYRWLYLGLLLLPLSSRPKSRQFDGLGTRELMRGYAEQLARVFLREQDLGFSPPWWALRLLGVRKRDVQNHAEVRLSSDALAEAYADRPHEVLPL